MPSSYFHFLNFEKKIMINIFVTIQYVKPAAGNLRPAWPDPAHEGLASGRPPCSAITLQSGRRNPSPKNAGFMSDVMSVMVKVPQLGSPPVQGSTRFQVLVDEVDVQYGDLLYFCEVRWPSRGAMISHDTLCATCRRRSPPFFVRRIFLTLISC